MSSLKMMIFTEADSDYPADKCSLAFSKDGDYNTHLIEDYLCVETPNEDEGVFYPIRHWFQPWHQNKEWVQILERERI